MGRYEYDRNDFERIRERREEQIQESVGEGYDARAMRDTLDQLTIQTLVDRGLLSLEAEALGLTVAKQEIERTVRSAGIFRGEGGRFDREAFERYAEYEFGNQRNFIEEQRQGLLATKLLRLLATQARVSDAEASEVVRRQLETVQLAIVSLDASQPSGRASRSPRSRSRPCSRPGRPTPRPSTRSGSRPTTSPSRCSARHILLRVEPGASAEAVEARRKQAEAIRARLAGGEDFAELASSLSEDPGSKESGGDLGFFKRGQMVKPFEDAAFALEPGELAPVVRSDFGFHVLRVEERKAAQLRTFDEVKARARARDPGARGGARAGAGDREPARGGGAGRPEPGGGGARGGAHAGPDRPPAAPPRRLRARARRGPGPARARLHAAGRRQLAADLRGGRQARPDPGDRARTSPPAEEIAAAAPAQRTQLLEQKRRSLSDAWLAERRSQLAAEGELSVNMALLGRGSPEPGGARSRAAASLRAGSPRLLRRTTSSRAGSAP